MVIIKGGKARGAEEESDLGMSERMYSMMMKEKAGMMERCQGIFTARRAKFIHIR